MCAPTATGRRLPRTAPTMISALEALERLRQGNRRFVTERRTLGVHAGAARRAELLAGQAPFAAVLGCADSRVPVELVFDQGLGDLFVIRVAGNVAGPSQVGSLEFAVSQLGTGLVVVLGHSRCGAVRATLDEMRVPGTVTAANLLTIVDRVRPGVEHLPGELRDRPDELVARAVRSNVRSVAHHLRCDSPVLASAVATEGVAVVGAEYALETGVVEFFDGVPLRP